jgi:hypothetical protein
MSINDSCVHIFFLKKLHLLIICYKLQLQQQFHLSIMLSVVRNEKINYLTTQNSENLVATGERNIFKAGPTSLCV